MRIIFIFVASFYAFIFVPFINAAEKAQYHSSFDVLYEVNDLGVTTVTQEIHLRNYDSIVYPKGYSILIDSEQVDNIVARDSTGQITPQISRGNGITTIVLAFNIPVIGMGSEQYLTVRYDNKDAAKKIGTLWEVHIPPAPQDESVDIYTVKLRHSQSLGPLAYTWPTPKIENIWSKTELAHGIIAVYGTEQVYEMTLSYHLTNTKFSQSNAEITLPPDTQYQTISIRSIEPLPQKIYTDDTGNYIAQYELRSRENIDIIVTIAISTRIVPKFPVSIDRLTYTQSDSQWNTDNPNIKELLPTILNIEDVYKTVVNLLNYNSQNTHSAPVRKRLIDIFSTPNDSLCLQYTDLFVTLARAKGIPARAVVGYAYAIGDNNRPLSLVRDVLHAWPEYYDIEQKIWVPVDPTWGDTTGGYDYLHTRDFSHVAFAIWSRSDSGPLPAGFYKQTDKTSRDIRVKFLSEFPAPVSREVISGTVVPFVILGGIPTNIELDLGNPSGSSVEIHDIRSAGQPFEYTQRFGTVTIAPFSQKRLYSKFRSPSYFDWGNAQIYFQIGDTMIERTFIVIPAVIFTLPLVIPILLYGTLKIVNSYIPNIWKPNLKKH